MPGGIYDSVATTKTKDSQSASAISAYYSKNKKHVRFRIIYHSSISILDQQYRLVRCRSHCSQRGTNGDALMKRMEESALKPLLF